MKKRTSKFILAGLVFCLVFMPIVFALDTTLDITTVPGKLLTIRFQDVDGSGTLPDGAFIDKVANADGELSVTFSSEMDNHVKISVGGGGLAYKYFRDIKTGWVYSIDMTQGEPVAVQSTMTSGETSVVEEEEEPVIEETEEDVVEEEPVIEETEEVVVEEEIVESSNAITGNVISSDKIKPILKKVAYVGGALIVGVFLLFGLLFLKKRKSKKGTSIVKINDKKAALELTSQDEAELMDAERRIKEAEIEINEIKNKKSELVEAEKKLEADKKRLEQLKGE